LPTSLDISANPHNYKIMELEGAQLPQLLDDPKVTVAIISTTYINQNWPDANQKTAFSSKTRIRRTPTSS
jgi:ABC-type metal ion transport system substrate-binding protein